MATEHLKWGSSEFRYTASVKYLLDFKNLVPKNKKISVVFKILITYRISFLKFCKIFPDFNSSFIGHYSLNFVCWLVEVGLRVKLGQPVWYDGKCSLETKSSLLSIKYNWVIQCRRGHFKKRTLKIMNLKLITLGLESKEEAAYMLSDMFYVRSQSRKKCISKYTHT